MSRFGGASRGYSGDTEGHFKVRYADLAAVQRVCLSVRFRL